MANVVGQLVIVNTNPDKVEIDSQTLTGDLVIIGKVATKGTALFDLKGSPLEDGQTFQVRVFAMIGNVLSPTILTFESGSPARASFTVGGTSEVPTIEPTPPQ